MITLLFSILTFAMSHTLDEAIQSVRQNSIRKDLLIYKTKDPQPLMQLQGAFVRGISKNLFSKQISKNGYFSQRVEPSLTNEERIEILKRLYASSDVEFAYFEPQLENAGFVTATQRPQTFVDTVGNYESLQFYLNASPEGVDARYGWTLPGGTGKGVRLVDVEYAWHYSHIEFEKVFWKNKFNGTAYPDHGTAVWGEVASKNDGVGVTGIAHDAQFGTAAINTSSSNYPVAAASLLQETAETLSAGDIIIIEQHYPLTNRNDFIPIEYFEPIFVALKYATEKGIHCIAAAGNGYNDLDDSRFNGIFQTKVRDSGCILVGAGNAPGRSERRRLDFSNYGSRVDAFGYGVRVTTTGYGDLFNGKISDKVATYTSRFSGTSSATPIVAGAVASVLGIAKAKGMTLTPLQIRQALRETGAPQQGNTNERIGNLPDIKQLVKYFGL